ncbi:MAG TPA: dihydrodipicolinate synthase family protein [Candidatus Hydrogenedentes bacterium]|nr:dihydrodipicolinate synthase family protein [Candidatus Hydrogenedentota bacterium]HPG65252.1 dihydrodipicolinate synthase family protein [Candidatus Hydrogenedentota bacterium]
MRPLRSDEILGNWATLLLPINNDDSIDFVRLADEVDALVEYRVSGIYSNGTAGEFYNQTEDEFDRVSTILAERCEPAGMPFQLGVSHMSPRISIDRLRRAVQLRPGAVQVILPDWSPVSDDEAIAFLSRAADVANPVGLVLYNPPHAKRVLSPESVGRLKAAVPALVGVKMLGGDAAWHAAMRRFAHGVSVFVAGHHLASEYPLGARGAYSNVACLHPGMAQHWWTMIAAGDPRARTVENRIRAFMDESIVPYIRDQGYAPQAVDKFMAAVGAWADIGTRLRWPYRWIPKPEADALRGAMMSVFAE